MELLETLKQTRDALDLRCGSNAEERKTLIPNLDTAIEQLEKAEPVAWMDKYGNMGVTEDIGNDPIPLYTHPAAQGEKK